MKKALTVCLLAAALAAVGCPNPIDWQNYTSPDGHYSVLMPGTPKSQSQQTAGFTVHSDAVELSNSAYVVSYADLPRGAPFDLDGPVKGAVNGMKAELVQSKEITMEGKPGREFTFKGPGKATGVGQRFRKGRPLLPTPRGRHERGRFAG